MKRLNVTIYRTIAGTFPIELPEGGEEEQAIRDLLQDAPGDQFTVLTDDFAEIEEDTENGKVKRTLSLSGPAAFQPLEGSEPLGSMRRHTAPGPFVLKDQTRPALPDGETMQRSLADLKADETAQSLSEQERQERLAFLFQRVRQHTLEQAFPPEKIQAISEGIERLLEELQAKRQAKRSQESTEPEEAARQSRPRKDPLELTFTYQPKTLHLEGWDEAEEIQELLVTNEAELPIPTGLGYAADCDEENLPLYYAVHLPSRQMILSTPLPTWHLIEKYLEGLLSSESREAYQAEEAVRWDRPYDELVHLHTRAKLSQIVSETMEKTRTVIGWATAENTLRSLLTQHGGYLQACLDRESYEHLVETLDRIACERLDDDSTL